MAKQGFEDLDCYQLAIKVFQEAYTVAKRLPKIEQYNLADQLRRAATSATLNIAEGYGRYHYLDKIRFYYIARGSLSESLAAFVNCQTAHYTTDSELVHQRDLCHRSLQALNGLIRYTYRLHQGKREYGDRALHEPNIEYSGSFSRLGSLSAADDPLAPVDSESEYSESASPEFTNTESTNEGG